MDIETIIAERNTRYAVQVIARGRWATSNYATNPIAANQIVTTKCDREEYGKHAYRPDQIRVVSSIATTFEEAKAEFKEMETAA